jgi:aryl-alcohol dehydrogenase-like predicted oxidoreductase
VRGTPQDIAAIEGTAAARYGRTPGEVAIAWTLRLPAVTGAIVGAAPATQESFLILGQSAWSKTMWGLACTR